MIANRIRMRKKSKGITSGIPLESYVVEPLSKFRRPSSRMSPNHKVYIGTEEYVSLRPNIMGEGASIFIGDRYWDDIVYRTSSMFQGTNVKGVATLDNHRMVTTTKYMFRNYPFNEIDLSYFNASRVQIKEMVDMFLNCKATICYARNQEDADKYNNPITKKPDGLQIIVVKP